MASGRVDFSLEGIEEVKNEVNKYEIQYNQEVENLKSKVNQLSQYWVSEEIDTYGTFKEYFDSKYPILTQCDDNLNEFREVLKTARGDFETASQNTNSKIGRG